MKSILRAALFLAFLLTTIACGHETKSALEKLEADKSLSDEKAVVEMAKAAWIFVINDDEKYTATTKDGKMLLTGHTRDTLGTTVLDQSNFRSINMGRDAKYMWRLFRSGSKRGLSEMVFTHKEKLLSGEYLDIYRVRLSLEQLKGIAGWDTADPYSTGEHDILDTDEALKVVESIVTTWTIEVDNTSQIKIN